MQSMKVTKRSLFICAAVLASVMMGKSTMTGQHSVHADVRPGIHQMTPTVSQKNTNIKTASAASVKAAPVSSAVQHSSNASSAQPQSQASSVVVPQKTNTEPAQNHGYFYNTSMRIRRGFNTANDYQQFMNDFEHAPQLDAPGAVANDWSNYLSKLDHDSAVGNKNDSDLSQLRSGLDQAEDGFSLKSLFNPSEHFTAPQLEEDLSKYGHPEMVPMIQALQNIQHGAQPKVAPFQDTTPAVPSAGSSAASKAASSAVSKASSVASSGTSKQSTSAKSASSAVSSSAVQSSGSAVSSSAAQPSAANGQAGSIIANMISAFARMGKITTPSANSLSMAVASLEQKPDVVMASSANSSAASASTKQRIDMMNDTAVSVWRKLRHPVQHKKMNRSLVKKNRKQNIHHRKSAKRAKAVRKYRGRKQNKRRRNKRTKLEKNYRSYKRALNRYNRRRTHAKRNVRSHQRKAPRYLTKHSFGNHFTCVLTTKGCHLHSSVHFGHGRIRYVPKHHLFWVNKIVRDGSKVRLATWGGWYLTANRDFVKVADV